MVFISPKDSRPAISEGDILGRGRLTSHSVAHWLQMTCPYPHIYNNQGVVATSMLHAFDKGVLLVLLQPIVMLMMSSRYPKQLHLPCSFAS